MMKRAYTVTSSSTQKHGDFLIIPAKHPNSWFFNHLNEGTHSLKSCLASFWVAGVGFKCQDVSETVPGHVQKRSRRPKTPPKRPKTLPQDAPRRLKMPPRCPKTAPRRRQDVPRRHKMPRHALKTPQVHPKTTRRHRARRSKTLQDAPKTSKYAPKMAQDTSKKPPRRPQDGHKPKWVQKSKSVDSSLVLEAFLEPKTPEEPPNWDQIGTKWELTETKWGLTETKVGPSGTKCRPKWDRVGTK